MHESTARLYRAALVLKGVEGQSNVARLLDVSPQTVNNWEARGVSESGALVAQKLIGADANWIRTGQGSMAPGKITQPPNEGMVHLLSHVQPIVNQVRITWETILSSDQLPEAFSLVAQDDSMSPLLARGNVARFSTRAAPVPGRPVLLKDADGNAYIRDYMPRRGAQWAAVAQNPAFQPLDSVTDGLRIVAVMIGLDWLS